MDNEALVKSGPPTSTEIAAGKFPDAGATVQEVREFKRDGALPERVPDPTKPLMPILRRRNLAALRRSIIANLMIIGYSNRGMTQYLAECDPELAVSESTVSEISSELRQQWRRNYEMTTAQAIEAELAKLDALEHSINRLNASGELKDYSDQMLKIAKRRANLLGLDSAKKVEVRGAIVTGSLSDEDLENIISGGAKQEGATLDGEVGG